MPKSKVYTVTLSPAMKTKDGYISHPCTADRHEIVADNFHEIAAQRDELIKSYGYSCTAFVSLDRGQRKSPGFDKWQRAQPRVFNTENIHPDLADEAHQAA